MTKIQKMTSDFLAPEEVESIKEALGKCEVTFLEKPHLETNTKFGNKQSYHVKVACPDSEHPDKGTEKTWNVNGTSMDYMAEELGLDDTDKFPGQKIELDTDMVQTPDGKKLAIYPAKYIREVAKSAKGSKR